MVRSKIGNPQKNELQTATSKKDLPIGDEARYTVEFTPKEKGFFTICAYLYNGYMGIGYKT
jgi:nitrogen fixation protein FixH